jgi:hypothetical protein
MTDAPTWARGQKGSTLRVAARRQDEPELRQGAVTALNAAALGEAALRGAAMARIQMATSLNDAARR